MGQNVGSLWAVGPSEPPGKQYGREVKAKGLRRESEGRVLRSHLLPITGSPHPLATCTHPHRLPTLPRFIQMTLSQQPQPQ